MSHLNPHLNWVSGYSQRNKSMMDGTYRAEYQLSDLMQKGYIDRRDGQAFLEASGLLDFHWEITWTEDFEMPDEMLVDRIANVQGYVVWVHGWTGNLHIWEQLPSMVVTSNRQLVSICIDHNGFGDSQFENQSPALDWCNPPAAMKTLQAFVDLLKIRRQPGGAQQKVINFVGHSMGGATLFYLNPMLWSFGEVTRFALAPALLLEDDSHRAFYSTLGLGIGILQKLPALEVFERFIKPSVLNVLASGASPEVKALHDKQYNNTPRGITGATLMAMGRLKDTEIAHDFDLMQVMLGHRDPLVGLVSMMDLLSKLEFPAKNIHVVPGTHYMFSVGNENHLNAYHHAQAREMVVEDVIKLHNSAINKQKVGPRFG
ncbi:MAG: alpha/beta hydrolase [Anaerolineae bacterium]|nr:alpha/beta hydrolase [Anaerolineae bacterium]MDQ7034985.1 alpha/beta hydrolase [Anaerolineae bacterium]